MPIDSILLKNLKENDSTLLELNLSDENLNDSDILQLVEEECKIQSHCNMGVINN